MDASSYQAVDQEWDLMEDLGDDAGGTFKTGLMPAPQTHGTGFLASPSRSFASPTKPEPQELRRHLGNHYSITVAQVEMFPNLTAEQIQRARELDLMERRTKSVGWVFGGIHQSDEHKAFSSNSSDPAPHKYAEIDRQKLRADYLGWMFGGVCIDPAHEDWNELAPAEKDALRAKLSRDQRRTDEQVGRRNCDFLPLILVRS